MKDNKLKPKSKFNILISESTVKSFSQLHNYLKDVYQVEKKARGHNLVRVAWKHLCKNPQDEQARKEALEALHQIITSQGLKLDKVLVKGRTVVSFDGEQEATSIQALLSDLTALAEDKVHWLSRHGYNVPNADSFIHGLIVYLQAQLEQEQVLPLTQRVIIKDILLGNEANNKNENFICFDVPSKLVESERFCVDCDEQISLARRETVEGCKRCIDCEIKKELSNN